MLQTAALVCAEKECNAPGTVASCDSIVGTVYAPHAMMEKGSDGHIEMLGSQAWSVVIRECTRFGFGGAYTWSFSSKGLEWYPKANSRISGHAMHVTQRIGVPRPKILAQNSSQDNPGYHGAKVQVAHERPEVSRPSPHGRGFFSAGFFVSKVYRACRGRLEGSSFRLVSRRRAGRE